MLFQQKDMSPKHILDITLSFLICLEKPDTIHTSIHMCYRDSVTRNGYKLGPQEKINMINKQTRRVSNFSLSPFKRYNF
jgi:hypothetical protein